MNQKRKLKKSNIRTGLRFKAEVWNLWTLALALPGTGPWPGPWPPWPIAHLFDPGSLSGPIGPGPPGHGPRPVCLAPFRDQLIGRRPRPGPGPK